MIVDAPRYVPNTVTRRDLNSKPHEATRQQAIAKTPAKWTAYQIPSVVVVFVFVILVFKV
jgi:hypothetical protein